jgi:hypothetical protein
MPRHLSGLVIEFGAKPLADLLAQRHAMDAADPTVTFGSGIRHGIIQYVGRLKNSE